MTNESKKTPLYDIHVQSGGKMVDFAGYQMPVSYADHGIIDEHNAVRERAGLFDVSHMGEVLIYGEGAFELAQKLTCNDVSKLSKGKAQYTCLMNPDGGVIDDLILYCLQDDPEDRRYLMVLNAANLEKDLQWIQSNAGEVHIHDTSDFTGLLALQGPKATEILQKLTDTDLSAIKFYHFEIGTVADIPDVIISATGYTGAGGFELYVNDQYLPQLWKAIMEAGAEYDILPAGLGARDSLRLEKAYCLYGQELNESTSPLEAGLSWVVKTKGDDFIGREALLRQKEEGIPRKLIAFKMEDRRVPRTGYVIKSSDGTVIGEVTSGTMSPTLDEPIGLGYVTQEASKDLETIFVSRGKKDLKATVVKAPFVD